MNRGTAVAHGLVAALLAMSLAGCGSKAESSTTKDTSAGLKGEPIIIADVTEITGVPGFNPQSIVNGETAAIQYINEKGGIDGRPLKLWTCDSKFDPAASTACGQKAVEQHPIAVTGLDDYASNGSSQLYAKSGIVSMKIPTETYDLTNTNAFPVASGGPAEYYGLGNYFGEQLGAKKLSQLQQDTPVGHIFGKQIADAYEAAGDGESRITYFSNKTTDFAPVVAKVADGKPDAVFTLINGSQIPLIYKMLQDQGVKASAIFNQGGAMDAGVFAAAGEPAVGTSIVDEFLNPDDISQPDVKLYREVMKKNGFDKDARGMFGQWGFSNVMFLAQVAKEIGGDKVDAATVKEYLTKKVGPGGTETIPVFMSSTPMTVATPKYPGLHRMSIQILQWDGSKFKTAAPMFVPALVQAS